MYVDTHMQALSSLWFSHPAQLSVDSSLFTHHLINACSFPVFGVMHRANPDCRFAADPLWDLR